MFKQQFERKVCSLGWTTNASATTGVSDTTTFPSTTVAKMFSIMIKTHSWDVAAGGASGCSGAYVQIKDDGDNVMYQSPELLTATTYLLSATNQTVPLLGTHTIWYKMCDGQNGTEMRVTSGAGTPWSEWNDPVVHIYLE